MSASPSSCGWARARPIIPLNRPPRYADRFPNVIAPHPPSFNEQDVSDKPRWIRQKKLRTSTNIHRRIDKLYGNRLRSMLAVDDLVGRLVDSLRYSRKLSNTYIVFTSDNGWSMGEHRRAKGKWSAYEEDIRVPLIVRGPSVPEGEVRTHMVLNNDFAPTFAQLGRGAYAVLRRRSLLRTAAAPRPAASHPLAFGLPRRSRRV